MQSKTPENTSETHQETSRFTGLLLAQIFFIAVTPWLGSNTSEGWILRVGVFSIILAGVWVASARRHVFIVSIVFLLPTFLAWLGPDLFTSHTHDVLRLSTAAISFAFSAVVVTRAIYAHETVTHDTVLGGINVYLLIAFTFQMLHADIMLIDPGSYSIAGEHLAAYLTSGQEVHAFATLLYFSFTTLTTLGYGDIIPISAVARLTTSMEAVVGQLFVAVFIGRLVALEVSQRTGAGPGAGTDIDG